MGLSQTAAPAEEPVSLADVKLHLRVDGNKDNVLIASLIAAAREYCQSYTGLQFVTATWALTLDAFPSEDVIRLPNPPLSSVTTVAYTDTAGDAQTMSSDDYDVDTTSVEGRLALAYGASWPGTRDKIDAVTITYVAGYGTAHAVPDAAKSAIYMVVADLYEHRESRGEVRAYDNPTVMRLLDSISPGVTFICT